MSRQDKIELLEARIVVLENENCQLKSMLRKQMHFGSRMTEMIAEMDELLEKKKLEIESLTHQLLIAPPDSKKEDIDDFCIDLDPPVRTVGFLEIKRQARLKAERLAEEFERTKDGKFKCPFEDICDHASRYRSNLRKHIRIHTGEKPYVCDFCGERFTEQGHCKRHMLTHPEMKGVQCTHCKSRFEEPAIESHQTKCWARTTPTRKRKRANS